MKKTVYIGGKPTSAEMTPEEIANLPKITYNYGQLVEEFIRRKYSLSAELAISNNQMAVFDGGVANSEKAEEYKKEYFEYQRYREECKKEARALCGMQ